MRFATVESLRTKWLCLEACADLLAPRIAPASRLTSFGGYQPAVCRRPTPRVEPPSALSRYAPSATIIFDARAARRGARQSGKRQFRLAAVRGVSYATSGFRRGTARPRFRFGLVRAPHEPPTSGGYLVRQSAPSPRLVADAQDFLC